MLASLVAAAAISVITVHSGAPPAVPGKGPAIIPTTVAFGPIDPNGVIPLPDGVPGAGVDNWDIAWPLGALARGTNYAETYSFEDVRYTGDCEFAVSIVPKAKGKPLPAPPERAISCAPGDIFLVSTQTGTIGIARGPAVGTLTVYYGTKQVSLKVPLVIQ